jgi:hypothetical protein
MPIQNENPLVIPAESEKTLSQIWVSELRVSAESASDGRLYLRLIPCDSESGEIADTEHAKDLHADLWDLMDKVPKAAAAMEAVFDAIPAIESYYEAQREESE